MKRKGRKKCAGKGQGMKAKGEHEREREGTRNGRESEEGEREINKMIMNIIVFKRTSALRLMLFPAI